MEKMMFSGLVLVVVFIGIPMSNAVIEFFPFWTLFSDSEIKPKKVFSFVFKANFLAYPLVIMTYLVLMTLSIYTINFNIISIVTALGVTAVEYFIYKRILRKSTTIEIDDIRIFNTCIAANTASFLINLVMRSAIGWPM